VKQLQEKFGLTKRQAQVALHLARGSTNREIAESLVISDHTAKRHTEQVFLKLGVSSRREVAKVLQEAALRQGRREGMTR